MMKRTHNKQKGPQQSNESYRKLATRVEKNTNCNSVFNGKNLSDGTKVSKFYKFKATPSEKTKDFKIAQQSQRQQALTLAGEQKIFTNNIINQVFDDNVTIKANTLPSNLTEVPRVNEKYEMSSFVHSSAQFKENLRTMELLGNKNSDPILNVNPIFFGSEKIAKPQHQDAFTMIKQNEHMWTDASKHQYVKNLLYYTDFDHPLSFHNEALSLGKPPYPIQYPSALDQNREQLKLVQNGFYSREPLSLLNPYKPFKNDYLLSVDERMFGDTQDLQANNVFHKENLLYKANEEIMRDIEMNKKEREYERLQKERERHAELKEYRVEELNPNGTVKTLSQAQQSLSQFQSESKPVEYSISPNKHSQYSIRDQGNSIQKVEEDTNEKNPRNIFQVKMDSQDQYDDYQSSPEQQMRPVGDFIGDAKYLEKRPVMDEQCRKELPNVRQIISKHSSKSPIKSVRFDDQDQSEEKYHPLEERKSSSKQASHLQSSQKDSEYYSEEGEGDDEEEDEVLDDELQNKIEAIKRNLKDTQGSNQNQDNINKLEDVLKRQRHQLDNLTLSSQSLNKAKQSSNEPINFELSKTSALQTAKITQDKSNNLEKAYEELEKEIMEIKSKLQKSLDVSQHNEKADERVHTLQGRQSSQDRNASGKVGRISNTMKSPGDLDEHDYSLSVSDLGNSLYNSSAYNMGTSGRKK